MGWLDENDVQFLRALVGPGAMSPNLDDEHERYAPYNAALDAAGPTNWDPVIAIVRRDPDGVMAESVLVAQLERAAQRSHTDADASAWIQSHRSAFVGFDYATNRADEWLTLLAARSGETMASNEVLSGSDWLQRRLATQASAPAMLAALEAGGRTKSVRHQAQQRLAALGRLPAENPQA